MGNRMIFPSPYYSIGKATFIEIWGPVGALYITLVQMRGRLGLANG